MRIAEGFVVEVAWSRRPALECAKMSPRFTPRTWVLAGLLALVGLTAALFHHQIRRAIAVRLVLRASNPSEALFDRLARQSAQPAHFLKRCWATGRVAQRRLVAEFFKKSALKNAPWFRQAEPLVVAGARDADMSVRELALATLQARHDPRLFASAREQLTDVDPLVRLMGLDYLRRCDPHQAVPVVIPLLDDPDLRVVTSAEGALTRWSGIDFGVRTRMAIPPEGGAHPGEIIPADAAIISQGVQRRKAWWQLHRKDYPAPAAQQAPAIPVEPQRLPTPDFIHRPARSGWVGWRPVQWWRTADECDFGLTGPGPAPVYRQEKSKGAEGDACGGDAGPRVGLVRKAAFLQFIGDMILHFIEFHRVLDKAADEEVR